MESAAEVEAVNPSRLASKKPWLLSSGLAVSIIAVIELALHLYAGRKYGYFVDELYYLDCARHLAWGYVDQPPLIAAVAWLEGALLGDSLSAIRLLAALSAAAKIILTGLLTRELGGRRFAQGLAALCILLAPGFLAVDHFLSMNTFEPLFWMGCAYLLIRMVQTGNCKLWLWFGVVAGVGLENKYSMAIFGFGLLVGLLLTGQRRLLRTKWLWIGAAAALLIFLPNVIWNIHYHFPFLELMKNIQRNGRNVALPPLKFFGEEALSMLVLSVPVWFAGLWFFFFSRQGKPYRFLGWAWLVAAAVILTMNPRTYYLFPAYPMLFAGGAIVWERRLGRPRLAWVKWSYGALMVLMGALLAPTVLPLLPPETYIRYASFTHLHQPSIENQKLGPLPQLFADQFGWPEMTATVAGAFNSLPPNVRARTAIFCQNYGQAGAIDLFGPHYGLPEAISGHQSYFLWGPRGYTGESVIVLGDSQSNLERLFTSVRKVAHISNPYSMPYNHVDVYYCQGLKQPLSAFWPHVKHWD